VDKDEKKDTPIFVEVFILLELDTTVSISRWSGVEVGNH